MDYFAEPFPVQVLSGTNLVSGRPASGLVYSWKEVVIDGVVGLYSGQVSPRIGVANAREINNRNLSGKWPFFTQLNYEGGVSGQPFYSFTGVPPSTASTPFTPVFGQQRLSGSPVIDLDTPLDAYVNLNCATNLPFDGLYQLSLHVTAKAVASLVNPAFPPTVLATVCSTQSGFSSGINTGLGMQTVVVSCPMSGTLSGGPYFVNTGHSVGSTRINSGQSRSLDIVISWPISVFPLSGSAFCSGGLTIVGEPQTVDGNYFLPSEGNVGYLTSISWMQVTSG